MNERLKSAIKNIQIIEGVLDGDYAFTVTNAEECLFIVERGEGKAPLQVGPLSEAARKGTSSEPPESARVQSFKIELKNFSFFKDRD